MSKRREYSSEFKRERVELTRMRIRSAPAVERLDFYNSRRQIRRADLPFLRLCVSASLRLCVRF